MGGSTPLLDSAIVGVTVAVGEEEAGKTRGEELFNLK
jgi:hypothetical protein